MTGPQRDVRLALARIRAAVTLLRQARDMAPHDAAAVQCCGMATMGLVGCEAFAVDMERALNEADARRAKRRRAEAWVSADDAPGGMLVGSRCAKARRRR